jgi:nucleotide-binding universal stress UspA family protein
MAHHHDEEHPHDHHGGQSVGEGPFKSAILGSTPHKLVHVSEVPVLCVPAESAGSR